MTQAAIAKKRRVSRSTVSDIATGRSHKEVSWPDGEPVPKRAGGQRKRIAEHDPTNKRILELEAEVIHLTDERNRERVKNKASAKTQGLFRAISLEMNERVKPFKALPSQFVYGARHRSSSIVSCTFSDGHQTKWCDPRRLADWRTTTFRSPAAVASDM